MPDGWRHEQMTLYHDQPKRMINDQPTIPGVCSVEQHTGLTVLDMWDQAIAPSAAYGTTQLEGVEQ